jgi:hypothetical protein
LRSSTSLLSITDAFVIHEAGHQSEGFDMCSPRGNAVEGGGTTVALSIRKMSPQQWPRFTAAVVAIVLSGSQSRSDAQEMPALYGSRLAPLPPGEGGDLLLTAPAELCTDARHELQLRRFLSSSDGIEMLYAMRGATGPSNCQWQIDGLREAMYDAVIVRRGESESVATAAQAPILRGRTTVMRLELAAIEIEGHITVNGAVPADAQLAFRPSQGFHTWTVPLNEDGTYRIKVDGDDSGRICIDLERARTQTIHSFRVGCHTFERGLRRFDADLPVPPGVLRVAVLPLAKPVAHRQPVGLEQERRDTLPAGDWTSLIVVVTDAGSTASSGGFSATAGFRGEYIGAKYQEYEVSIQTVPAHRILARARVVLTPDRPIAEVQLRIPPASLSCDEGWWSAC